MKIHREGYQTIVLIIITIGIAIYLINYYNPVQSPVHYLFYLASIVFLGFIIRFFRDPHREVVKNDTILLSPADGKVVVIDEAVETEYFKDKRLQVSIFMSPNNVHKNWYPSCGTVEYYRHHPGKFLVAWHPKSSELNERTTVVVKRNDGVEILLRQIAGAVAQRISCYAEEGKKIEQGQELGFIKFGSRVDIFLPVGTKIKVEKNQKVTGCSDIIAQF
jgi:phosphatidylserine decarboxylase